jgi:hypothetical protein
VFTSTRPTGGDSAWVTTTLDRPNYLWGVSCPSISLCVAVGGANVVSSTHPTGGASRWITSRVGHSGLPGLLAVSCPSASLCVAVDHVGNAVLGQDFALSPTHIKRELLKQLVPSGNAARIGALLSTGWYRLSFKPLTAGKTLVAWYHFAERAPGAKRRGNPLLVAIGRKTFTEAKEAAITLKLTTDGRRLLEHSNRLALTAKCTFTETGERAILVTKPLTLTR